MTHAPQPDAHPAHPLGTRRALRGAAKATPGDAKLHNRVLVLQTLHTAGALSRADLARHTGLTKVTVSGLIAELIDEGIVHELGIEESQRPGKPAILVDIARDDHLVVALDLSDHRLLHGALLTLDGAIVTRAEVPRGDASGDATGDAARELVVELALDLICRANRPIIGLGVATPGVVDAGGTVRTAPNLGWTDLPLQQILADRTGLPTIVANDANVAALAEYSFGDSSDNMILVRIGYGVGAGLIVDGAPVVGSRYASGEIGQVMVGTDLGLDVEYSRDQVLEHWLSAPSLTAALEHATREAADAPPAESTSADTTSTGTTAAQPAQPAQSARERVLREAGQRLGIALAPVVGALNLAEVVIAGPAALIDRTLADAVLDIIRRRTMPDSHNDLVLRTTSHGDDLILLGATATVLQERLGIS